MEKVRTVRSVGKVEECGGGPPTRGANKSLAFAFLDHLPACQLRLPSS